MQLEQAVECLGLRVSQRPSHATRCLRAVMPHHGDAGACVLENAPSRGSRPFWFSLRSWREPVIQINHDGDGDCGLQLF